MLAKKRKKGRRRPSHPSPPSSSLSLSPLHHRLQYNKALASYDAAIKATPPTASAEVADLRVARAGCFLLLPSKLKEARSECDAALEASPGNLAALTRRARANEGLGMFKAALGDVQKALRGVASGAAAPGAAELREQEARLKDVVSGKRPASSLANGNGTAAASSASPSFAGAPPVPRGLGGAGLPAANGAGAAANTGDRLQQQRRMQAALAQARAAQLEQARAAAAHFATHVTARISLPSSEGSSAQESSSQLVSLNGEILNAFCSLRFSRLKVDEN